MLDVPVYEFWDKFAGLIGHGHCVALLTELIVQLCAPQ